MEYSHNGAQNFANFTENSKIEREIVPATKFKIRILRKTSEKWTDSRSCQNVVEMGLEILELCRFEVSDCEKKL